ncbi:MAG: Uma2 family endonuclease [Bacteroides sp.]|nr:Uma2 family endonuclease [Bacteroides sp.]
MEAEARILEEYTVEDIFKLSDGERAELTDGQIYYMSPPSATHQKILGRLYRSISSYVDSKKGECEVMLSPFAVFLNKDDRNYFEPDLFVVCDKDKITEKGCSGAPDWTIEIVSPSSRRMDYYIKLFKYREAGVREYWIVDPQKETTAVYNFEKETMEEYAFTEAIPAGIYEDLSVTINN